MTNESITKKKKRKKKTVSKKNLAEQGTSGQSVATRFHADRNRGSWRAERAELSGQNNVARMYDSTPRLLDSWRSRSHGAILLLAEGFAF